jgi:hypothetical protein
MLQFLFSVLEKRTNTSCYLAIPTHGFTVVLSVFGGTPSTKPLKLNSKIRLEPSGRASGCVWAHHTGEELRLILAKFSFAPEDIIKMSLYYCHSPFRLSLIVFRETKNPAYIAVSRVWEILESFVTCLPPVGPTFRLFGLHTPWTA